MKINKLTIIGMGMMGASFAAAVKQTGICKQIMAHDSNQHNLQTALAHGIITHYAEKLLPAISDTDIIVIAIPVGKYAEIFSQIHNNLDMNTILTDLGSTKFSVIQLAQSLLKNHFELFVPGHPIAGSEKSGISAFNKDLFKKKRVILTPTTATKSSAIDVVKALWEKLGANVELMDAAYHDEILAKISHLPHALAFLYMNTIANHSNDQNLLNNAGKGFHDFTRIAGADPILWKDIFLTNEQNLINGLNELRNNLDQFIKAIEAKDEDYLVQMIERSRKTRSGLSE